MGTVAGAAQAGRGAPSCFPFTFGAQGAPKHRFGAELYHPRAGRDPFCYHQALVFGRFLPFRHISETSRAVSPPALSAVVLYPRRSEERRGGKECVSTCRSRWSTYH